jgi:predicted secreted Zn-dependent protease
VTARIPPRRDLLFTRWKPVVTHSDGVTFRENVVRSFGFFLFLAASLTAIEAHAGVKSVVNVETYSVAGDSGEALMAAMDRNGPRHGFLTRAIAQTRYSVDWDRTWLVSNGRCRLMKADVTLKVNYRYPALAGKASPELKARWGRFVAGVRKHEETHGRLARRMAQEAYDAAFRVVVDNDRFCSKAKDRAKRIVRDIYADYEAQQERFDALEHQPGGPVEKLVNRLTGRK